MANKQPLLTKTEEDEVIEAIQTAESNTSGEIRVHIEPHCKGKLHKQAKKIFRKLKMQKTRLHNGVLIYIAALDQQFYILGDKGIHNKVPENFWRGTKDTMQNHFKNGEFKKGLIKGILSAGEQLKHHFPHTKDDTNELSDEISRG